ncbi:MAG TPA: hypothetical protein EYP41_03540, partial [Anaerolineae bacterium]|nr:hypothetical protein [Anaerolineae bacterium]
MAKQQATREYNDRTTLQLATLQLAPYSFATLSPEDNLTSEIALVLFILGVAIVLFASEKIQADLVALMVMLALILTGILTPREGFSGFSNPAVITVWAIYIVSAGLLYTGVADGIGRRIRHVAGGSELRLLFVILVAVAVMSAFMNNIGATAVLLPVTIGLG